MMECIAKIILTHGRSFEADKHCVSMREIFEKVGLLDIQYKDKS